MTGTLLRSATAALLVLGLAAGSANAQVYVYSGGYVTGAGYSYGSAYAPAVAYTPAVEYRPVVVHQPVVVRQPVVVQPVVPVAHYAPAYGSSVRVSRQGRRIQHRTYTPYGVHEWDYKYDRCGRLRDVDYDFDD